MGFQDVAFIPSRASFSTTFLRTVVGRKQGHAPCDVLLPQQSLFLLVCINVIFTIVFVM